MLGGGAAQVRRRRRITATVQERLDHVKGLPSAALRVFEIDQRQPAEAVAGAVAFLRQRGVV